MRKLIGNKCAFVPPVSLERYEDFEKYAKKAAVVTYNTEYFQSPFKGDEKRFRRVVLSAVGVRMDEVPLTFTHTIDYSDFTALDNTWQHQTRETNEAINAILADLETKCNLVRGTISQDYAFGEALVARP